MTHSEYSTWLEIDLGAIAHNVTRLRAITERPVLAVVKANGYGHGLVPAGQAAQRGGATWLGVARIEEALALRSAGLTLPILVLGYAAPEMVPAAIAADLHLAVFNPETASAFSAQAMTAGGTLKIHAKFDIGMGRLGVFPEDGLDFMRWLGAQPALALEGMFTHFPRADEPGVPTNDLQIKRFTRLVDQLQAVGLRPRLVHAANSAAALGYPAARFDMVRSGIAIYGLHPSPEAPLPEDFRPALTWKARLAQVKTLPAGHGVGYNVRYTTHQPERIGAIAVGYADGFRRRVGNFALVRGVRVPVVGGVCMDQCMLQLDSVPDAQAGDEVVLVGRQGDAVISAEEQGKAWNTVNYDVVCGLQARVPRIYVE